MPLTQVQQSLIVQPDTVYGPLFSVYLAADQTVTSGSPTKIAFANEVYDTNDCFDTTLSRFTPNVAGYYMFTGRLLSNSTTNGTFGSMRLYKNGALYMQGSDVYENGFNENIVSGVVGLIYCNGTSDYVECWGVHSGTGTNTFQATSSQTYFAGFLARPA